MPIAISSTYLGPWTDTVTTVVRIVGLISTKKKDWRSEDVVLLTLEEIKKQARERGFNSFHFSFSGGEPTVVPTLPKLLDETRYDLDNCNWTSTHLTSNISRKLDWWEKYVSLTKDFHRVSITASYHKDMSIQIKEDWSLLTSYTISRLKMYKSQLTKLWSQNDLTNFGKMPTTFTIGDQCYSQTTVRPYASFVVDGYTPRMLEVL